MPMKQKRRVAALTGALALERHALVAERSELARAFDALKTHEGALERAREAVVETEEAVRRMLRTNRPLSLDHLDTLRRYMPTVRGKLSEAEENCSRGEVLVQKSNQVVVRRHARIRSMERVSERAEEAYDRELQKVSSREIEDLWLGRGGKAR